jgi:hypothetical protein
MVQEASFDSGEEQDTIWDSKEQFRSNKKFGRRHSSYGRR